MATTRNTRWGAVYCVKIMDGASDQYWPVCVEATLVPGHSAVDHLADLAVDLSPIDGQVYISFRAGESAARQCVRHTVTTDSGRGRYAAPEIQLAYGRAPRFYSSQAGALQAARNLTVTVRDRG